MNIYVIKTNQGYVKSIHRSKLFYTDSPEYAKLYNSSHKCTVALANNKPLFKKTSPSIYCIKAEIEALEEIENLSLSQYW